MSSVGQTGASSNDVTGLDQKGLNPVEFFNESVKRGYDGKISQSHNDALLEKRVETQHRLTEPKVESQNPASMRSMQETLLKSEESIVQADDLKNIANLNLEDDLSPETNKLKNDLKLMQGVKELENILGHKLEATKKGDLLRFMAETASLSKLSETEDAKGSELTKSELAVADGEKESSNKGERTSETEGVKGQKPVNENKSADEVWDDILAFVNGDTDEVGAGKFSDEEKAQIKKAQNMFNSVFEEGGYADTAILVGAMSGGPPELISEIKSDFNKLTRLMSGDAQLWDTDEITIVLSAIQQKMQDNRLKFDQETIKIGQIERERVSKETIDKLKEQITKSEEARNASLISKIFSYIALAIMAIATVAAFATGVGAVAGAALIAAMAMMVVMTVDQEMGGKLIMEPMTKSIMDTFGVDKQTAGWIATAIIMAIMIVLSVGGGAGAAATKAAGGVAQMAQKVTVATMVIGGATSIGEGAAGIASGVKSYEAEMLKADAKELNADMLRLQQLIDDATESLQQALEDLQAGHSNIASMMASNDDTKKLIGRNIKGS